MLEYSILTFICFLFSEYTIKTEKISEVDVMSLKQQKQEMQATSKMQVSAKNRSGFIYFSFDSMDGRILSENK